MRIEIGNCEAHAGVTTQVGVRKYVHPVAAVQDTTAGNQISKVVGEVLHRHDVFSDGFAAWIYLCPVLRRWVRVR